MNIKGIIYLGIALLTFAFTHLTDKIGINSGVAPSVFSFFSIFFGLLLVGVVWFTLREKESLSFEKKDIKHFIIIGVLASGLSVALSIYALEFTTATNKGIMQGMYSSVTLILAYFMLHERLPKLFFPLFAVMIFGLILLTSNGLLYLPNKGDWILFLTIPIVGFCNVYAKKTMKKIKSLTVSFGRYIFGALFLLMILPFFSWQDIGSLQNGLIWVVLSGVLGGIRVLTFYKGVELEGPTMAATVLAVSPAITAISEFLILDTKFSPLQITGLVLVLICAIFITRFKATYKIMDAPEITSHNSG